MPQPPRGLGVPVASDSPHVYEVLRQFPDARAVQHKIDEAALASTMFSAALALERMALSLAA